MKKVERGWERKSKGQRDTGMERQCVCDKSNDFEKPLPDCEAGVEAIIFNTHLRWLI